jgi:hypothetical protein
MICEHVDVISSLYIKFKPSERETHKNMQFLPGRYGKRQATDFLSDDTARYTFRVAGVSSFRLFMV